MTTRIRILILLLSAMVCLAIVTSSGSAYNHYAIHYGRHGWGPPEVAFLLHYLLFGATAVVLLGAALDLAMGRRLTDAFDRLATLSARSAWSLTALASVLVFGLVTLSRYGLLGDTAITDDENVYTFMARTFASGRLYLESMPEPVRPFFNNQFIINDGKWYGIYFPGHPALLALGERFHLMHWVPTVSATLTVPLTFAVGRRVFGPRAALLALPLLALSPFFILSSATLLGHSTAGLLLMAFLYSTVRVLERPERMVWWLAAGIALAWTGLTRPVSAAAFALPWLVLLALSLRRSPAHRPWAPAMLFCLIGVGSAGAARRVPHGACPETRSPAATIPSAGSPACPSRRGRCSHPRRTRASSSWAPRWPASTSGSSAGPSPSPSFPSSAAPARGSPCCSLRPASSCSSRSPPCPASTWWARCTTRS